MKKMLQIFLLINFILMFFCIAESVSRSEFSSNLVLEAQWGQQPGQFGYSIVSADGDSSKGTPQKIMVGPDCIYVDLEDNIYILDQINNRLQKFSQSGLFISVIPLEFPSDVDNKAKKKQ